MAKNSTASIEAMTPQTQTHAASQNRRKRPVVVTAQNAEEEGAISRRRVEGPHLRFMWWKRPRKPKRKRGEGGKRYGNEPTVPKRQENVHVRPRP